MAVLQRKTTGGSHHLLCATVLGLLFKGIIPGKTEDANAVSINVKEEGKIIALHCKGDQIIWKKDGNSLNHTDGRLLLGSVMDDPRGVYQCSGGDHSNATVQIFVRMCQNCIELNLPTIIGLMLASFVATLFLAVAVYHIAAEESGRRSRASDKQTLLANDQLYQPLGERDNGQYSHIGVAKTRHR